MFCTATFKTIERALKSLGEVFPLILCWFNFPMNLDHLPSSWKRKTSPQADAPTIMFKHGHDVFFLLVCLFMMLFAQ